MTAQTLNKAERESLVFRVENLPDKFMLQIKEHLERIEEEILREEKYNEYFNPHNMKRLLHSIEQANSGKVVTKTLAELEAMEND
jgi:HPt (histidine-containing phosphotransfer) domain-containing protein